MADNNSDIRRNVAGKYWVQQEICLAHQCCDVEAPHNFAVDEDNRWIARVFKQPENSAEEAQCQMALECCPIGAIRDDGDDL